MIDQLIIGTRGSDLALAQTHIVRDSLQKKFSELKIQIKIIRTTGDQISSEWDRPIPQVIGEILDKGVFTKELDMALLNKEIDCAVHSAKDLPTEYHHELTIASMPNRLNVADVLIAVQGQTLRTLPSDCRIGTSSPRRMAQLKHLRPDLDIVPIRGNVPTRIEKLKKKEVDALVLAQAGLERLHLDWWVSEVISIKDMLPAAGQGALAIVTRHGDSQTKEILSTIHDANSGLTVKMEKLFLERLGGGCRVPIGVYAYIQENQFFIEGGVFSLKTKRSVRHNLSGVVENASAITEALAQKMLATEALEILAEC